MGRTSHTDTGWLSQASQVSGSERAAQQLFELANSISYARPAGPNVTHPEQNVPVPNQQEVYSQMLPATSHLRGIDMLTTFPVTLLPPGIIPGVDCHISRRLSSVTSPPKDSAPCCPSIPLTHKMWTACTGIGGRHPPDSVDDLLRNQWSPSTGLRNQARVEAELSPINNHRWLLSCLSGQPGS